ncbi:Malate synthase [Desmophyllum pertusum]|uniref:malate synthase n=1 Tax=Desmophyllum pertusum TaxID=174260 RepID=A0A9W9Z7H9_9CNID|nr:Malate synthase [Desmophyllum pertusum]
MMCGISDVELSAPPSCYEVEYQTLLTPEALNFVVELVRRFDKNVEQMLRHRTIRKLHLNDSGELPFSNHKVSSSVIKPGRCLLSQPDCSCRAVDLGDISPANTELFTKALNSPACGIQEFQQCLMLSDHVSTQGLEMLEFNMMVGGRVVPGPLFDFGLHMFHNSKLMMKQGNGPFFTYLSVEVQDLKLEGSNEVKLWNENLCCGLQQRLGLPLGSIKASVLIESIFCSFELDQIRYELRQHSAGLNCGMWDYSASLVRQLWTTKRLHFA